LHSRVDTVTRDCKYFSIRTYIEHIVVERVRAIEVDRLAERISRRITEARNIAQARIAVQTDGLDPGGALRVCNAVGQLFR
jgi:hypothetical protein